MVYILLLILLYGVIKVTFSVSIHAAQLRKINHLELDNIRKNFPNLNIETPEYTTKLNRVLKTVIIERRNQPSQGTIIIFHGQNATFRSEKKLATFCQLAIDTGYRVVGFDYGGTGLRRVTTWSYLNLVDDGYFIAEKMASLYGKESLIFKCSSLGGFIGTLVARECHDNGIPAFLWNGRSGKGIADVIAAQIRTLHLSGHYENNATILLSKILRPFISLLLLIANWNIEVTNEYKSLPKSHKNFYVIRSPKNARAGKKDDSVIPYCASLGKDKEIKQTIKKQIREGDINNKEDIAFYVKNRKFSGAHGTPEIYLYGRDKSNSSAYEFFCLFATSYVKKVEKTENLAMTNVKKFN
jgi:hypothetical protein